MRLVFLALALAAAAPAAAGVWSRQDPATLRFEGSIEPDEYERFARAWSSAVREVIVTSPGGVTGSAIRIAHVIAAADVKVTVEGECMSSCANYLFVAGRRREIRRGLVGFHGNVLACFGKEPRRSEMLARWERNGMAPEDIRRNLADQDEEIAEEAHLLRMRGVSQELFDRSCTKDKGMNDGRSYGFLLPKRTTFERYGLMEIVGEQDPDLMRSVLGSFVFD